MCDWADITWMYVQLVSRDLHNWYSCLYGNFDPYTVANCLKTLIPVEISIIYWWKYNVTVLRVLWFFCLNAVDLFICLFFFQCLIVFHMFDWVQQKFIYIWTDDFPLCPIYFTWFLNLPYCKSLPQSHLVHFFSQSSNFYSLTVS